jgi:release factor glutamine methyltransferase
MNPLTIANCLTSASQLQAVSDTARLDTELLLMDVLQKNRTYLYAWPEIVLSSEQQKKFSDFFSRRLSGEPIAHILGYREFWSLSLDVDASTLIPRPDTEVLVEVVLDVFKEDNSQKRRLCLDLGTGTGAIALALASEKPHWQLTGVDKSEVAVELAEKNRKKLDFSHVKFFVSDWFGQIPTQEFDVIVSNPPYIASDDVHLQQGDLRFEPTTALVAKEDGFADIKHIIQESWNYLSVDGWLVLEHGYQQAQQVRDLLIQHKFSQIDTRRDYAGHERVTLGKKKLAKKEIN